MEDKKYKIADLQEKSEEWKIPFSNLLAGFVLEEFMLRFSASEFKNRFLLRNGTVLGLEQYRKKNILKLDFFCEPDERIPEKLLQLYLQKKEQSPVRWKGTISSQQAGTCLELQGQFEEMKVPVTVGIHFMHLGKIWGLVERQIPFLMDETVQIEWKEFPAELVLAKQIFVKGMPLMYNEILWAAGTAILNQCYSMRGLEAVAATNISSTIFNVFNVVYMALGVAVGIVVGQKLGAGEMEEARETDTRMIVFAVLSCLGLGVLLFATAPLFPAIYNTTDEVRALATNLMRVSASFMPMYAFLHTCYYTLRSGGKTVITFFFDSGFIWVCSMPLAFCLARFTSVPLVTMYALCQGIELIKCVIGFILVKKGVWLHNLVSQKESA